ncbi:MAG: YiiG family protein [bacterium]|nr:YiiG family protein [bacterium]MCM1375361.1 YiiG family protein [Muribaculum sp.]
MKLKAIRVKYLALACAVSLGLIGCGQEAQVGGAVDRGLDMEDYTREESSDSGEMSDAGGAEGVSAESAGELNEYGLDAETMDLLKYNIYVELNNTIVEIMDDINNYFLVVDTADEFRFRDDAEYSYGYRIKGFNLDAVEDAELVYGMEPFYENLDGLVKDMLPSVREIIDVFNAIDDSEYTYEENQYQQPKENHIRLMACLDEFTHYAEAYLEQVDIMANERSAAYEEKMLEEGRLITYYYSHMLTVSSQILDEIDDQGIDDYNLTELDLTPIYPLFEELQATAAACDEAVTDNNQLMKESLSNRQVYAGKWSSLVQAFEWMIKQVESGVPYEDPSREYLGGLQHIYVVLSDRVDEYNGIFTE